MLEPDLGDCVVWLFLCGETEAPSGVGMCPKLHAGSAAEWGRSHLSSPETQLWALKFSWSDKRNPWGPRMFSLVTLSCDQSVGHWPTSSAGNGNLPMSGLPWPSEKGMGLRFNHQSGASPRTTPFGALSWPSFLVQNSDPYTILPVVGPFTYVTPLNALVGPEMSKFSSQFYWEGNWGSGSLSLLPKATHPE